MGGRGWSFPLAVDARGAIRLVSGREAVESRLSMLLATVAGERVMRPDLGIHLDWTTEELPDRIGEMLADAESSAEILDVQVRTDVRANWSRPVVGVVIDYRLRDTGERYQIERGLEWIV